MKTPINGKQITREQALEGLGDPSTWQAYADKIYAEMNHIPKEHYSCGCNCHSVRGKFDLTKRTKHW